MLQTKDALFECLAAQDGFISGELLAERLGVSRSAVWKAVGELRAEGCRIEAAQNRGYALRDPGSRLSAGRIQALLRGRAADCRVLVERTVDSTNDELKRRAAAGCPTGTVLVAERQTGGKGRAGPAAFTRRRAAGCICRCCCGRRCRRANAWPSPPAPPSPWPRPPSRFAAGAPRSSGSTTL